MAFQDTKLHRSVHDVLKDCFARHGLELMRADEHSYSDDLLGNIETYLHGCSFAVAVVERLTTDAFNPNVSFEVGYMSGLGRPVLLLKDKTLPSLQSDLAGRLYREFDIQEPESTIPAHVARWLTEKRIASR